VHKQDENANTVFIREIRSRLDNYFSLVIRNVRDTVPKLIGFHLIKKTQESLNYNMWHTLNYERKDILEKLVENDNIALERDSLSKQLTILKNAYKVIKKDPYLSKLYNQANSEKGDKSEEGENKGTRREVQERKEDKREAERVKLDAFVKNNLQGIQGKEDSGVNNLNLSNGNVNNVITNVNVNNVSLNNLQQPQQDLNTSMKSSTQKKPKLVLFKREE